MKPAAEEAAQIHAHYLRLAARGVELDHPDTFAEIQGVMQDMIDEAVNKAVAVMRGTERQQLPPDWTYSPGVQRVTLPPLAPDAPPLGPMCVASPSSFEHKALERFVSGESYSRPGDEDADGDSR